MNVLPASKSFVQAKRNEGLRYTREEQLLLAFCKFIGPRDLAEISSEQILKFLEERPTQNHTWRQKHQVLTRFFEYWRFRDMVSIVPMPGCRPMKPPTFFPYVFVVDDIKRLLCASSSSCSHGNCESHGETLRIFLLFLYATGCHSRAALALKEDDFDLDERRVTLRIPGRAGFCTIPICVDLSRELSRYLDFKRSQELLGPHLFQKMDGAPLMYDATRLKFVKLLSACGIRRVDGRAERPRLSDLRATFAADRVTAWLRNGDNLATLVPALAAYMGKQDISDTERILNLAPERFRKNLEYLSLVR